MAIERLVPQTIPLTNIVSARFTAGGTISLPVAPGEVLYARFKHITGVPAVGLEGGFSIDRLRALDNLIDRLVSTKGERAYARDVTGLKPDQIDVLIARYERQLHEALGTAHDPYTSGAAAGIVLNGVA